MTSLEVLSNRTYADLLIRTRRSKLSPYPRLSLCPHRCLFHLARHWAAVRRDLPLRRSFRVHVSTAICLARAGLLGLWLDLGVSGFRSVLACGWHGSPSGQHGEQAEVLHRNMAGFTATCAIRRIRPLTYDGSSRDSCRGAGRDTHITITKT